MKLYFKKTLLIFGFGLIIQSADCREIVLVTYIEENQALSDLKKILQEDLSIPEIIIKYKKVEGKCVRQKEVIMHLCLEGKNLTQLVSKQNIIRNAFPVFLKGNNKKAKESKLPLENNNEDT